MEDGLWRDKKYESKFYGGEVLILVLMEDGLWQMYHSEFYNQDISLNPCFNGRWSLTTREDAVRIFGEES